MFTTIPGLWDELEQKIKSQKDPKEAAFNMFLEIARNQYFNDGNKRTGQLMMNGILLSNRFHVVTFPDKVIPEFFDKIINYYETGDMSQVKKLLSRRQNAMEQAFSKESIN
ncbi:MAG: Fic family protein [Desulfobacteraceae bacterium]|nr:Fic family protein [Desulfobacteraceae bacterium]